MRVHHVKSARKNNKAAGIKIGDSYYWWAFRRGGKRFSKTPPKRQQLTQSDFLTQVYDLEDRISDLSPYVGEPADLKSELDDIASDIRTLGEEQDEKFNNMPEGLQQGDTGQLLEERRDACESWAEEIESIDVEEPDREAIERKERADSPNASDEDISRIVEERYEEERGSACASAIEEAQGASSPA